MTTRTTEITVRFAHPFTIEGIDRAMPPGEYRVVTEEEPIEGLSFLAYRRVSTAMMLPAYCHSSISARADRFASAEMMWVKPADLARALERDAEQSLTN
jgi:hypothetical protein